MTIGVQGVRLPIPQALYPTTVGTPLVPQNVGSNAVTLPQGGAVLIPSGLQSITLGRYSMAQFKEPVSGIWMPLPTNDINGHIIINSDGDNFRVANPLGCVVGVLLTDGGGGYTVPPSVTFSSGGASAAAVIGGAVGSLAFRANSGTVTSGAGSGYTLRPIVSFAAPPSGGVQATAVAHLSGTALNGFTITNQGAGYNSAPTVYITPHPDDDGTITPAQVTASLTGAGSVTAILVKEYGNGVLAGVPAVTIGASPTGVNATGTAIVALTTTSLTVTATGSNYQSPVKVESLAGDVAGTPAYTNPATQLDLIRPRQALYTVGLASGNLNGTGTRLEGGIFTNMTHNALVTGNAVVGLTLTAGTVTLTVGSATDTVYIQPLGGSN